MGKTSIIQTLEDIDWCAIAIQAQKCKKGDRVTWSASGGQAVGKIISIHTKGSVSNESGSISVQGTPDDPAAKVKILKKDSNGEWQETGTVVVHKLNSLKKHG